MVKEYINPDGYRIKASEKAYNLLYKKNGFMPVEAAALNGETSTTGIIMPIEDAEKDTEKAARTRKGKEKAAASKSGKGDTVTKDISKQEETSGDATDRDADDQDAAEQPEGE